MTIRLLLIGLLIISAVQLAHAVPTASISCPSTAFVGEPVICDGSGSTNVNGQVGWSVRQFTDGTAPVAWDFGDNLGPYSKAEILRATHVYLSAGTYTIGLTVKDSASATASTSTSITVSDIPAATGGGIQTLTDSGNNTTNCTNLQNAINTAFGANTAEQEIRLPAITFTCELTIPAATGNKYVTIRPTDVSWMPSAITRIAPASHASNMPKLKATTVSPTLGGLPLAMNGSGRKYLRLLGIEFQRGSASAEYLYQFLEIGYGVSPVSTFGALPHHVIIDRCYFHGNTNDDTVRAILLQGDYVSIINSYFRDLHAVGADSQSVTMVAGTGFGFVNNFADGYGENILWGGADTPIAYQATASSASTTSCTLSSTTDLTVGMPISFLVVGSTAAGSGFSTGSASGQVTDASTYTVGDTLYRKSDLTIIGKIKAIDLTTTPDTITLFQNALIAVSAGENLALRGVGTTSIVRSIAGSVITYDALGGAPDTTTNAVKYGATPQDIFVARNHFYKDPYYKAPEVGTTSGSGFSTGSAVGTVDSTSSYSVGSKLYRLSNLSLIGTIQSIDSSTQVTLTANSLQTLGSGIAVALGAPTFNGSYRPTVKNSIEVKHGMRMLFVGNYVELNWAGQGQSGPSILFTVRNQSYTNPWAQVRDIQYSDNRGKWLPDVFNFLGQDDGGGALGSGPAGLTQYIVARNNLHEEVGFQFGYGSLAVLLAGPRNITLVHNTTINSGGNNVLTADVLPGYGILVVNNIGMYLEYGPIGTGFVGTAFVTNWMPDGYLNYNVMSDDRNTKNGTSFTGQAAPNYFPATIDTGTFVDRAAGNYRLKSDSPYKAGNATPAADGTDIGINYDDLAAATLNSVGGNWTQSTTTAPIISNGVRFSNGARITCASPPCN